MGKDNTKKVIIIGNSPSILKSDYGSKIDGYDIVIRINHCPTEGFEDKIGKKINIWSTTKNICHKDNFYPSNIGKLDQIWHRTDKTRKTCKLTKTSFS